MPGSADEVETLARMLYFETLANGSGRTVLIAEGKIRSEFACA